MTALSETSFAQDWLNNFEPKDQESAALLLDRIMLVGASEFHSGIVEQLKQIKGECPTGKPCLALYAEREIDKLNRNVLPFFPGTDKGRATGDGIPPVQVNPINPATK